MGMRNNPYDGYLIEEITVNTNLGGLPYKGLLVCAGNGNIVIKSPGGDNVTVPVPTGVTEPFVLPIAVQNVVSSTISNPTDNIFGLR